MKKTLSKRERKKAEQKKQLIVGLILVSLMVFSTIAYSLSSRDSDKTTQTKFMYKGVLFFEQGEYFIATDGNFQLLIFNDPRENKFLQEELPEVSIDNFFNFPLYLDSEYYLLNSAIAENLGPNTNGVSSRVQLACIDEEDCAEELPIKNCQENIIVIRESNASKITKEENCIFISGNIDELPSLVDTFIQTLFGI